MYLTSNNLNHYEPEKSWVCCTTYKDKSYFQNVMEHIDLSLVQKQIIQSRYLHILENFQKRTRNHSIVFFIGHFIVTVGSLFVPALLSVQNSGSNYTFNIPNFTVQIYWATFIISLMVTICNGILALFKIDKKYYFLNTTLERLRSEGWQYFGLTGRYSGHLIGNQVPTHQNQFVFFIHYIEKLAGIPYRYEKCFRGQMLLHNQIKQISLDYLVRPLGLNLEYDWKRIKNALTDAQIGFKNHHFGDYEIYNAHALTEFMLIKYAEDIFWTLTGVSKIESQKKLDELGRGFRIEDFEPGIADA